LLDVGGRRLAAQRQLAVSGAEHPAGGVSREHPTRPAQLFTLALTDVLLLCGCSTPAAVRQRDRQPDDRFGGDQQHPAAPTHWLADRRHWRPRHHVGSDFLLSFSQPLSANDYLQAGTLGALCFAASLLVQGLIRRLRSQRRHSPSGAPARW
jgi:two-component system sensor histidine kinase PilS (NtrC family)